MRAPCTVHGAQCTVHGAWCTVHNARCTVHDARCTVHGAWCTVHGAPCTVHHARCTVRQLTVDMSTYDILTCQLSIVTAERFRSSHQDIGMTIAVPTAQVLFRNSHRDVPKIQIFRFSSHVCAPFYLRDAQTSPFHLIKPPLELIISNYL